MADNSGNIGYLMGSSIPIRDNHYPYVGCKVLDGQTSRHDWIGFGDFSTLPFHINPKKGYFINGNNRQYTDKAASDIGATHGSTARTLRLNEIIESKIKEGHKFTPEDMVEMQ